MSFLNANNTQTKSRKQKSKKKNLRKMADGGNIYGYGV